MKVLIACEESQRVCTAFREKGHEAYSADIQDCSGGHPEWHIKGDCLPLLNGNYSFSTQDGAKHTVEGRWDLIIAHPPCTFLSNAGATRLYPSKGVLNEDRYLKGLQAKEFFMNFVDIGRRGQKICIENPIPTRIFQLPQYSQIIQPFFFGEPYLKKTCLWLFGLKPLQPAQIVEPICSWVSGGSNDKNGNPKKNKGMPFRDSKTRSKTFEGIAKAMAEQWG